MKNLAKNRSTLGFGCKALLLLAACFGSQAQQLDAIDQAARQSNSAQLQQFSQQHTALMVLPTAITAWRWQSVGQMG